MRNQHIYATDKQMWYLRKLWQIVAAQRIKTKWNQSSASRIYLKTDASDEIAMLKDAISDHGKQ